MKQVFAKDQQVKKQWGVFGEGGDKTMVLDEDHWERAKNLVIPDKIEPLWGENFATTYRDQRQGNTSTKQMCFKKESMMQGDL